MTVLLSGIVGSTAYGCRGGGLGIPALSYVVVFNASRATTIGYARGMNAAARRRLDNCRRCPDADVHTPHHVDPNVADNVTAHYRCDRGHEWTRGYHAA